MSGTRLYNYFDVNTGNPIDSRFVVDTLTSRNNLLWKYDGLKVYVISEKKFYIYEDPIWKLENNGIYSGSGSLPDNVTVDFGSVSNVIDNSSNYFQYKTNSNNYNSFFNINFTRKNISLSQNDYWRGIEVFQQLNYDEGTNQNNSSYISFNPKTNGIIQDSGGIAFGTGFLPNEPVKERVRISNTGNIGIATTEPKEFLQIGSYLSTQLPLVFHNSTNASIAYNWFSRTQINFFDNTKGSSVITFRKDNIDFSTRSPNESNIIEASTLTNRSFGIGTNQPIDSLQIGASTSIGKPLIFHNSDLVYIGYNWFRTNTNQNSYFSQNSGSSFIRLSESGVITFTNRAQNSTSFIPTLNIFEQISINTTIAQIGYTLTTSGIINSRITQANNDINSRDVMAGRYVETTQEYKFSNSPSNIFLSIGTSMSFYVSANPILTLGGTTNSSFTSTEIINNNLIITNNSSNSFSPYQKGIVFRSTYNNLGSYITHYQGDSNQNDMGISVFSRFQSTVRETIRTSNGGKRIQIGVPNNITSDLIFSHQSIDTAQIDTFEDMHVTNSTTQANYVTSAIVTGANLLRSGYFSTIIRPNFTDDVKLEQSWYRIGRILHVKFKLVRVLPTTDFSSEQFLPLPIGPTPGTQLKVCGKFVTEGKRNLTHNSPIDIRHGYVEFYSNSFQNRIGVNLKMLDGNPLPGAFYIHGSYVVELP